MLQAAGYVKQLETIKLYLDSAKKAISMLMKQNAGDGTVDTLKKYYTEAKLLYDYLDNFKDSYLNQTAKLTAFEKQHAVSQIDFDFIFDGFKPKSTYSSWNQANQDKMEESERRLRDLFIAQLKQ